MTIDLPREEESQSGVKVSGSFARRRIFEVEEMSEALEIVSVWWNMRIFADEDDVQLSTTV